VQQRAHDDNPNPYKARCDIDEDCHHRCHG
jgi:hypothetical protein